MFNERSDKWIKIYKVMTIILFFGILLFSFVAGIGDASGGIMNIGLGGNDNGSLDFFVWILIGTVTGTIHLVFNMLLIQFFSNIQMIRERIGKE